MPILICILKILCPRVQKAVEIRIGVAQYPRREIFYLTDTLPLRSLQLSVITIEPAIINVAKYEKMVSNVFEDLKHKSLKHYSRKNTEKNYK